MLGAAIPRETAPEAHLEHAATGVRREEVPEGRAASLGGDRHCAECGGTGLLPYRSESVDGAFEWAYRLCPEGCAPRYCAGPEGGRPCPRPATVRLGLAHCCEEHAAYRPG